jgi:fluoride exporter
MKALFLTAAGGAIGASARHLLSRFAIHTFGPGFPWGTLLANTLGGFAMGLLAGWLAFGIDGGRQLRLFLGVGLLGGFTTFSAFSLETALMIERKAWGAAAGYVGVSVVLAIGALFLGLVVARRLFAG